MLFCYSIVQTLVWYSFRFLLVFRIIQSLESLALFADLDDQETWLYTRPNVAMHVSDVINETDPVLGIVAKKSIAKGEFAIFPIRS